MLQKELAKRLRGRFETEPDGDGWLAVSSDGMPLCRVKYNGNCIVNDNPYLSEEYIGKIAEVQNELLTVKEYISLYEHAPQMKAADVSDYRQLVAFGDTVLAATYSEKNGFMFCTWKQNADGDSVFWGDYSLTMNMSRKLLPCVPVSSAKTDFSVRMNRHTLSRTSPLWTVGKECSQGCRFAPSKAQTATPSIRTSPLPSPIRQGRAFLLRQGNAGKAWILSDRPKLCLHDAEAA